MGQKRAAAAPLAKPSPDAVARILAAAEDLFAQRGYASVSMSDIAEAAAVSKANIFHHFSTKKDLYLAVVRDACTEAERLKSLGGDPGPLAQRLGEYAQAMLRDMLATKQVHRLILRELLKDGEALGKDLAEKVFGDNFARLVDALRAGQKSGELRADIDPAMVATLLIGANVFFFQSQDLLRHFPDVDFARDPARYSRQLIDLLLYGVAAPENSADRPRKNPR